MDNQGNQSGHESPDFPKNDSAELVEDLFGPDRTVGCGVEVEEVGDSYGA